MSTVIAIHNVSFDYGELPVLEAINLKVEAEEFLGLVGPNGGGKSTLLKIMLGLLSPRQGHVEVLGKPPKVGRLAVGYVPQFAAFRRDFPVSVEETVLMGRLGRTGLLGGYSREDRRRARQAMERTEVQALARRSVGTLSGGQLQRVLIARALATDPQILILDEHRSARRNRYLRSAQGPQRPSDYCRGVSRYRLHLPVRGAGGLPQPDTAVPSHLWDHRRCNRAALWYAGAHDQSHHEVGTGAG